MNLTLVIIGITVLVSWRAFNNPVLLNQFMFNAYQVQHQKEWWRVFTHGLLHGDFAHLAFNMFALWMFGGLVEDYYQYYFAGKSQIYYLMLYIGGVIFSTFFSLQKHKNNPSYNALGASGAVSAIVFASILLEPNQKIGIFIIPPIIPGWLFGIMYLAYTSYMDKKGTDNTGHDAHFWGAIYGFALTAFLRPQLLTDLWNHIIS